MIEAILEQWPLWGLTHRKPALADVSALPRGMTNQCWRLHLPEQQVVVRVHADNSVVLDIDREREYRLQRWAVSHGLAPRVLYRARNDAYWLMEFVDGRCAKPESDLLSLAHAMNSLHSHPPPEGVTGWRLADKTGAYWAALEQQGVELLSLKTDLQQLALIQSVASLHVCHMDTNPDNWRLTTQGWKLLDWEYATVGSRLWDLAGFAQACELSPPQIRQWCQLFHVEPDSWPWRWARWQLRYLAELWFGVQNINTGRALECSLQQLLEDGIRLQSAQ